MEKITELPEAPGVFLEAVVVDSFRRLVFCSMWGRTAAIQSFIAQVTLGQISTINYQNAQLAIDKEMLKKIGKVSIKNGSDIVHGFLYKKTTQETISGRRDLLFLKKIQEEQIFRVVKSMLTVPTLPSWEVPILSLLREKEMLINLETICGHVHGFGISLSEEDELIEDISKMISSRKLQITSK